MQKKAYPHDLLVCLFTIRYGLTQGTEEYKRCVDIVLDNTNISPMEMLNLGYTVFNINDKKINQLQFPLEEYRNGHIISKEKG